ncbi:uncharacterized protein CELE_C08H9.18 [Caenorhabditis elegans]|uniref:Uncharacterized protein n=1 Tax=Caenorhabditis elegans TaxID=6239 RepID=E9P858_CAEEL|nr:Uncharacterized protein CELE_C08H9.18 [Caenorhabditis elegans]CBZ01776.1 Uncharacterized protein CELE_C08H9.18 [Caenorhabditis elegans]|eukprot:NP_001254231.1 Uncharacterized protein CELE_C08H9.18 [Caenorhabditis elegans]
MNPVALTLSTNRKSKIQNQPLNSG